MDARTIAVYIGAMVVLMIMSAYFSATETAFTSLNRIKIKNLAEDGDKHAKRVLELVEHFDKVLTTIHIGNNIVNIANTAVATVFFVALYGSYGPTVATVVMTVTVLIFGEISPKNLAKENAESFAMMSAPLLSVLMKLFAPFNWIFSQWKKFLFMIFKKKGDRSITEDELITMVEEAETEGSLESDQSELIQNAIEFDALEAVDVLTPRTEIEAIDIEMTEDEVAEIFLKTGFSRLPVYENDLDNILGVLNQKDFHNYIYHKDKTVSDFIKPVIYAPESMSAGVLLKRMQKEKCQIAIVVDEYGGTTGLVAMEDILEELVGEIYDEHEEVESQEITKLRNGSYRVLASANVEKMFDYFDDEDEESEATTVNGWVVRLIDKLPEVGDRFTYRSQKKIYEGHVTSADDRKANEINLTVRDIPEEDSDTDNTQQTRNQHTDRV